MPQTFIACPVDHYVTWLHLWTADGGKITHVYDYPYERANFLLALADFRLGGECGSRARPIVVPPHVRFLGGDTGHCNLYFINDGTTHARGWVTVPIYSDPEFATVPGYAEAVAADQEAARQQEARRLRERPGWSDPDSDLTAHIESERDWA
jgi:hypothetical protein